MDPRKDGAQGRTRTGTGCPTRPSNVRVYQFRHLGSQNRLENGEPGKCIPKPPEPSRGTTPLRTAGPGRIFPERLAVYCCCGAAGVGAGAAGFAGAVGAALLLFAAAPDITVPVGPPFRMAIDTVVRMKITNEATVSLCSSVVAPRAPAGAGRRGSGTSKPGRE